MAVSRLPRSLGRAVFGLDPAAYHAARPVYPQRVYDILAERCGLAPGRAVFEVGPGTGIASARLLEFGADPLVGIEPDARLAAHLRATLPAMQVREEAFEQTSLPDAAFDLGVAATSFHWVEPGLGLAQVARLLRSGGWWAMVWNGFGDPDRPDPFHEATVGLLGESSSPSAGDPGRPAYAEDHAARRADLAAFEDVEAETLAWTLRLDSAGVRALYATYSEMNAREPADRERLLDALSAIAGRDFADTVERNMLTTIWTARRV
jgi:SAM-dependent methyltransferase